MEQRKIDRINELARLAKQRELTEEELAHIFQEGENAGAIKDALLEACQGKTRDNFSFYVLSVQNVKKKPGIKGGHRVLL